jgi:Protein of unknown function (DUF3467)
MPEKNPSPPVAQPPVLEIPPDLEPHYSNLARISHSVAELVIDFARFLPGNEKVRVQSRVLMSPIGAKMFWKALGENIKRYEAIYGEIHLPGDDLLVNDLFRPHHSPEPQQPD